MKPLTIIVMASASVRPRLMQVEELLLADLARRVASWPISTLLFVDLDVRVGVGAASLVEHQGVADARCSWSPWRPCAPSPGRGSWPGPPSLLMDLEMIGLEVCGAHVDHLAAGVLVLAVGRRRRRRGSRRARPRSIR